MPHPYFDKAGIPVDAEGARLVDLFVSPSARLIGVTVEVAQKHRVFVRTAGARSYSEVLLPLDCGRVSPILSADAAPFAFCIRKPDELSVLPVLLRIDLVQRVAETTAPIRKSWGERRVWISELLAVSGDARSVWTNTGHEPPREPDASVSITYSIGELDVETGVLTRMTELVFPYA